MNPLVKSATLGLAFGLLGMILAYGMIHLVNDHIIFHNLLNGIAQQQVQQRQQMEKK